MRRSDSQVVNAPTVGCGEQPHRLVASGSTHYRQARQRRRNRMTDPGKHDRPERPDLSGELDGGGRMRGGVRLRVNIPFAVASHGYLVVMQDGRGRYAFEGEVDPTHQEFHAREESVQG